MSVELNYNELSDDELVSLVKSGDSYAEEYLLNKYRYIVKRDTRFLYIAGAEVEDLLQEGMIGLIAAIRTYVPGTGAAFSTFATTCVRNKVKSYMTSSNRQKNIPLNSYISIYSDDESDEHSDVSFTDQLIDRKNPEPEEAVLKDERMREVFNMMEKVLSPMEIKVVNLYVEGESISEIAAIIKKDEKSVNNALSRARTKMRNSDEEYKTRRKK